jgi:hypothetical protein
LTPWCNLEIQQKGKQNRYNKLTDAVWRPILCM